MYLFERPKSGERAVLIQVNFVQVVGNNDLSEVAELTLAAGGDPIARITARQSKPNPKYFVNTGKLDEIATIIKVENLDLVIFNHELSPSQERNIEAHLKCRVLSRTGLILDIFAQRARTFEGKLQVELAQLQHLSTRLVRGWTHLERQKGGIGLRGPGETQLESDRRMLRARIQTIESRLSKVKSHRDLSRRQRKRQQTPLIALVGYTNAGKSTLFNAITGADVLVANQLFATLDPTVRGITLPSVGDVVLADTVGFVKDLPHKLVEAFHATLEETTQADLILHVVDAHAPSVSECIEQVNEVLKEIGAENIPQVLVYNKTDLMPDASSLYAKIERDEVGQAQKVWVCALKGLGLDSLREVLVERSQCDLISGLVELAPKEGKLRAKLYALQAIKSETLCKDGGWQCTIHINKRNWYKLCFQHPGLASRLAFNQEG
jgi:GTP-binding protein HflX